MINQMQRKKGILEQINSSNMLLISFAATFFPRILDNLGAPSTVNFFHFILLPLSFLIIIFTSKPKERSQIRITYLLLVGMFALLSVMIASAILNNAGIINIFFSFLLLVEPFLALTAIVCIPFSTSSLNRFRTWLIRMIGFHLVYALLQKLLITIGIMKVQSMTAADNVQGVFYLSGSGHMVGASVSICFALYMFVSAQKLPLWVRYGIVLSGLYHLLAADAKQLLILSIIAWIILIFTSFKDLLSTLKYIFACVIVVLILIWCIQNVELFRAFNTWIRPGYYGPEGIATQLKIHSFSVIKSHYNSPLNWLLGLGPGHSVGRLGGWMLDKYGYLLTPLGATTSPVASEVFAHWRSTWSWLDSSMFSPLFGWAGIWGDFGLLGLAAYLSLARLVWCHVCLDDFSKFLILSTMLHGFLFTQMEEPGYMVTVAFLIALRWHECRFDRIKMISN